MNDEKKIAQAILDAHKLFVDSFIENEKGSGCYSKNQVDCLIETCKQQGLSDNLWQLLSLGMYWWHDIQLWAQDVLAGKNILAEIEKENEQDLRNNEIRSRE